jgi:hypothetical protein
LEPSLTIEVLEFEFTQVKDYHAMGDAQYFDFNPVEWYPVKPRTIYELVIIQQ